MSSAKWQLYCIKVNVLIYLRPCVLWWISNDGSYVMMDWGALRLPATGHQLLQTDYRKLADARRHDYLMSCNPHEAPCKTFLGYVCTVMFVNVGWRWSPNSCENIVKPRESIWDIPGKKTDQYHGCWCSGCLRLQDINYGIDWDK